MSILDNINLDFQVINTGDPKVLVIMDTSVWGAIENKNAIIEITIPGHTNKKIFNFVKGKSNIFNSSNLLLSGIGEYKDIPDGVYTITLLGAHGNCKERFFLKTDKIKLLIGDLYLEDFFTCKNVKDKNLKELRSIKLLLDYSEIKAAKGEVVDAAKGLSQAYNDIRGYIKCRD